MTFFPFAKRAVPSLMGLLLMSACASSSYDAAIDKRVDDAQTRVESAKKPTSEKTHNPLQISDSVWLGDKVTQLARGLPLPPEWERDGAIALRSDNYLTLSQVASLISTETRIPIRLTGGAGASTGAASGSGAPQAPSPLQSSGASAQSSEQGMVLSYEGPLSKLLDLVCGYFNVNWTYSGGSIAISRFETRTFVMDALPGAINMPSTSSQGSGSSAAQPLASPNIDIWNDIQGTLKSMIGTEGSIDVSQSSGTIVVSTTSDRMEKVASYLSEENDRLSRQVAITVDIYTVTLNDAEDYGLDGFKVLNKLGGNWSTFSYTGVNSATTAGAASLPFTILEPDELQGTTGILRALSTLGKTTRLAQIPLTTLNNRPAIQNVGVERGYVSKSSTTTSDTTVTAEIETDTVNSGVSISVLPRIMTDGRIFMQYALTQSDVLELKPFESGSPDAPTKVQLPEIQNLTFSQQVMLKSGSTLVLAGYDQGDTSSSSRGVGRPLTWALGGGVKGSDARQIVVISITPREIVLTRPGEL